MVKNLILLIAATSVLFLTGEITIRYLVKAEPFETTPYIPSYMTERDRSLRWRFPSGGGRNSLGLRNREVESKGEGTFRILFLGDSLFWDSVTSTGRLYTDVLERALNIRFSDTLNTIEVINAGIPGYTTFQELEFLKIYGMDMKPDLVILGFVFNDLFYKYLQKPSKRRLRLLDNEPDSHLFYFDTRVFPGNLFARSHLMHELVRRSETFWKMIWQRPVFPFDGRADFFLAWQNYGYYHVERLIYEMQTMLSERSVPLAMVVFPIRDQVDDRYRKLDEAYVLYPQEKISQICDDYGIPMFDLTNSIYKNGGRTLFKDYLHLNAKGNDLVAVELEMYLAEILKSDTGG